MTTYHKSRPQAEAEAQRIQEADDRILWAKAEMEPYNGWVVVVAARPMDLRDLEELGYEIDKNGRRSRDAAKKKPTPVAQKPGRVAGEAGVAPRGGVTARVWAICAEQGGDRAKIMAACAAEGINKATAGTQYAKWKRSQ